MVIAAILIAKQHLRLHRLITKVTQAIRQ